MGFLIGIIMPLITIFMIEVVPIKLRSFVI